MLDVRKTPPALKWMAEKRARLAADVARLEGLASEVKASLARARKELAAVDTTIRVFDANIDPAQIPAVRDTKSRYGGRGNLKAAVLRFLDAAGEEGISTPDIALLLAHEFNIALPTPACRDRWKNNGVRCALRRLVAAGLAEQVEGYVRSNEEGVRWRRAGACAPCADRLREQAAGLGVPVRECDDDPESTPPSHDSDPR